MTSLPSLVLVLFLLATTLTCTVADPIFPDAVYEFAFRFPWGAADRRLTASSTFATAAVLDPVVTDSSNTLYSQKLWQVINNDDGTVYIQKTKTSLWLGIVADNQYCRSDRPVCIYTGLKEAAERWIFVESTSEPGRYFIQLARPYRNMEQPILGPKYSNTNLNGGWQQIVSLNPTIGHPKMTFQIIRV